MTNEDVVRLVAAGTPESEILDAIRTKPAAFDVSEEMIQELRLAGVPDSVVAAMKARTTPPPAPAPDRPPRGTAAVAVALSGTKTLKCPAFADEDVKARLHLPKEIEERQVKDLAIFLACTTAGLFMPIVMALVLRRFGLDVFFEWPKHLFQREKPVEAQNF